jgi:hypothetical protein
LYDAVVDEHELARKVKYVVWLWSTFLCSEGLVIDFPCQ